MRDIAIIGAFWLHLGTAVFWVGGIAFILFIALPSAKKALGDDAGMVMGEIAGRFGPLANWCILILIVTGIGMTAVNSSYGGITPRENSWTAVLHAKLGLAALMVGIHFFRGLVLSKIIAQADSDSKRSSLSKLSLDLVKVNLALGSAIILLSGALAYLRGY